MHTIKTEMGEITYKGLARQWDETLRTKDSTQYEMNGVVIIMIYPNSSRKNKETT